MDLSTLFGIILGIVLLGLSVMTAQGSAYNVFVDGPSLLVVLGGTFAAVTICFPWRSFGGFFRALLQAFVNRSPHYAGIVRELVALAEIARQDGLLALERRISGLSHPFLARAVMLAVDGTRPELLEDVMRTEIEARALREKNDRSLIEQIGRFAPAFGMIGTLVGLIVMLGNLENPESFAPGMAMALITTLYGAIIANLFCLPFAEKLQFLSRQDRMGMEIMLRGVLAIQAGDNPRLIEQRLGSFLPEHERRPWKFLSPAAKKPPEIFSMRPKPPLRKAA
ncbi:MAG: MotA/TolQ/ExbB proton channel family protein [Pirellulales bacterium]|nr:MotA/TolQ/ExbB proton channel family protein [Pirellulales bacterium]